MDIFDWINDNAPIIAILISLYSVWYTWKTNTKKYELSEVLRKEILDWYSKCIHTLVSLRLILEAKEIDEAEKFRLNVDLYTLTEEGRFLFPNYDRSTSNPPYSAYDGHRSLLLDLLARSYKITSQDTALILKQKSDNLSLLKHFQKAFTSEVFDLLKPDAHIKLHTKNTELNLSHHKTYSASKYSALPPKVDPPLTEVPHK